MSDTRLEQRAAKGDTRWVLNLDLYKQRTSAKGAETAEQRRVVAGLSRSTEHRWKRGITVPDWEKAREVAKRLNVGVHELIVEVAA